MLRGWVEVSRTHSQELLQLLCLIVISAFLFNEYCSLKPLRVFTLLLFFVCFVTSLEFSSIFTHSPDRKAIMAYHVYSVSGVSVTKRIKFK